MLCSKAAKETSIEIRSRVQPALTWLILHYALPHSKPHPWWRPHTLLMLIPDWDDLFLQMLTNMSTDYCHVRGKLLPHMGLTVLCNQSLNPDLHRTFGWVLPCVAIPTSLSAVLAESFSCTVWGTGWLLYPIYVRPACLATPTLKRFALMKHTRGTSANILWGITLRCKFDINGAGRSPAR